MYKQFTRNPATAQMVTSSPLTSSYPKFVMSNEIPSTIRPPINAPNIRTPPIKSSLMIASFFFLVRGRGLKNKIQKNEFLIVRFQSNTTPVAPRKWKERGRGEKKAMGSGLRVRTITPNGK